MKYYKLLGGSGKLKKYIGSIIKENPKSHEEWYWNKQNQSWQPIGIMMNYTWIESPEFEQYEELTEDEVMRKVLTFQKPKNT